MAGAFVPAPPCCCDATLNFGINREGAKWRREMKEVSVLIQILVCIGGIAVMLYSVRSVHVCLKEKQQGYGPNSLKALGISFYIPALLIITVLFSTEIGVTALVALWGTVGGYLLGQSKSENE